MKKLLIVSIAIIANFAAIAQLKTPVKWTFTAKKIAEKTYEVHLIATIDKGWHMYAIDHKADVGIATSVNFSANPLATQTGKLASKIKAVKLKDPSTGELVKFYENKVDLVQVFKLKANVKTNITGTLEFMVCDDKQCLPPTEKTFSISLK
jgi:hypothetical protein